MRRKAVLVSMVLFEIVGIALSFVDRVQSAETKRKFTTCFSATLCLQEQSSTFRKCLSINKNRNYEPHRLHRTVSASTSMNFPPDYAAADSVRKFPTIYEQNEFNKIKGWRVLRAIESSREGNLFQVVGDETFICSIHLLRVVPYARMMHSEWGLYAAFEKEREVLQHLSPAADFALPEYVASFDANLEDERFRCVLFRLGNVPSDAQIDTVAALADAGRHWSNDEAHTIASQLVLALEHQHSFHPPYVHGNISPSNVLIARTLSCAGAGPGVSAWLVGPGWNDPSASMEADLRGAGDTLAHLFTKGDPERRPSGPLDGVWATVERLRSGRGPSDSRRAARKRALYPRSGSSVDSVRPLRRLRRALASSVAPEQRAAGVTAAAEAPVALCGVRFGDDLEKVLQCRPWGWRVEARLSAGLRIQLPALGVWGAFWWVPFLAADIFLSSSACYFIAAAILAPWRLAPPGMCALASALYIMGTTIKLLYASVFALSEITAVTLTDRDMRLERGGCPAEIVRREDVRELRMAESNIMGKVEVGCWAQDVKLAKLLLNQADLVWVVAELTATWPELARRADERHLPLLPSRPEHGPEELK